MREDKTNKPREYQTNYQAAKKLISYNIKMSSII